MAKEKDTKIEIARSFSYKMSLPKYENRDFFCSAKEEVLKLGAEKKSEELFEFVKDEVMKSVYDYKIDNLPVDQPKLTQKDFAVAKQEAPSRQAEEDTMADTKKEKSIDEGQERSENITTINEEGRIEENK